MWHEVLAEVIRKTLSGFGERLAAFGPNLLAMILILALGALVSGAVRGALRWLLPRLGFDAFAGRIGFATVLQGGGISARPSAVVALTTAWAVLGVFVLLGIGALDLPIAMVLLSRTFTYLPQVCASPQLPRRVVQSPSATPCGQIGAWNPVCRTSARRTC